MKLYEVPRNSKLIVNGEEWVFRNVDGMYSYITRGADVIHLAAGTPVKEVDGGYEAVL